MDFTGYDIFKIQKLYNLSGEDIYSLTNLYLPLIGVDSFALYFFLAQLENNTEYQISKIMDNLGISNSVFLSQTIAKLEGIGLINSFYSSKNGYLFEINSPLSVKAFMNNHLLVDFLESRVGLVEKQKLEKKIEIHKDYKEISKSFDEAFERTESQLKQVLPSYFKEMAKDTIYIKNSNFDYTLFKLKFDTKFIDPNIFNDLEFREEILKISFHYHLDEEEMYYAVMQAIQIDKDLKIKDINKHAQKIYQEKSGDPIKFAPKEPIPLNDGSLDENYIKFYQEVEKLSCEELLKNLSGIKPSLSELKMFSDLAKNTGFSQGVINVMILYANKEKNGEIPSYNYFEKIANNWKRANVKNAKDAMELINKKSESFNNPKGRSNVKTKDVPDWYQGYEERIKKESLNITKEDEQDKALQEILAVEDFGTKKEKKKNGKTS